MTFLPARAVASAEVIFSLTAMVVEPVPSSAVLTVIVGLPPARMSALNTLARVFSMKRTPYSLPISPL